MNPTSFRYATVTQVLWFYFVGNPPYPQAQAPIYYNHLYEPSDLSNKATPELLAFALHQYIEI